MKVIGNTGGNAHPKKSINLKPTNNLGISLLKVNGSVAKYIMIPTMKHSVKNIIAFQKKVGVLVTLDKIFRIILPLLVA